MAFKKVHNDNNIFSTETIRKYTNNIFIYFYFIFFLKQFENIFSVYIFILFFSFFFYYLLPSFYELSMGLQGPHLTAFSQITTKSIFRRIQIRCFLNGFHGTKMTQLPPTFRISFFFSLSFFFQKPNLRINFKHMSSMHIRNGCDAQNNPHKPYP